MFSTSLTFNILVLGEMTLDFIHVKLAVVAVHRSHHLLEGRLTSVHPHAEPVGKGTMSQELFERKVTNEYKRLRVNMLPGYLVLAT
jgi:hypothetical protein